VPYTGTVALRANDADPASFGVMPERQFRGAHVVSMHLNTGWSAHLMLRLGWRASMQQCPLGSELAATRRVARTYSSGQAIAATREWDVCLRAAFGEATSHEHERRSTMAGKTKQVEGKANEASEPDRQQGP
jgi:hypothetical protein